MAEAELKARGESAEGLMMMADFMEGGASLGGWKAGDCSDMIRYLRDGAAALESTPTPATPEAGELERLAEGIKRYYRERGVFLNYGLDHHLTEAIAFALAPLPRAEPGHNLPALSEAAGKAALGIIDDGRASPLPSGGTAANPAQVEEALRLLDQLDGMWAGDDWVTQQEDMRKLAAQAYASLKTGAESQALADIAAERRRQIEAEGWTPEHDDGHANGEMARAAACYAYEAGRTDRQRLLEGMIAPPAWPWDDEWWKPRDRRWDLVRAGALIAAEIERLDRASLKGEDHG